MLRAIPGAIEHQDPATGTLCWACGGPTQRSTEPGLGGFEQCPACGLVFGASGDVHDLYVGEKYLAEYGGGAVGDEPEPRRDEEARVRVELVRSVAPAGRLLEVGSAGGHFLAAARDAGYDVVGIEPSGAGAEAARRRFGLEVHEGFVEEIDLPAESFDAIASFHVLEHIPEPLSALERMRTWLKPEGALVLEVPNRVSRQARRAGANWRHLDLAHHVSHFTPAALGALLERAGFAVERIETVAYATYRTGPLRYISAARELGLSGGNPLAPHPWRYILLQAVARRPAGVSG